MNRWTAIKRMGSILLFILLTFCPIYSFDCWGQGPPRVTLETTPAQKLSLTVGKSIIIHSLEQVKRVSLVSPEIADAMVLTPNQIYLIGKAPGLTNLTLWGTDNNVTAILDLEITPEISRLKEALHTLLPEEKDIKITATHDHITLAGTVSSAANLSQVLSLAGPYAPLDQEKKPKMINVLEVAGVHQVMLEVRVSEMSRSLLRRLGFNFNYISSSGRTLGLGMLNKLTTLPAAGFPSSGTNVSDSVNALFRFLADGTTWTVFIDALKEEGLLKVLAEPTLITLSGKTASFLAGGEFPIPVPQSTGAGGTTITIDYKAFGIGLSFTPTVLGNKKISMHVAPEVSELDFTNAITASGFVVPALTTRRVSTVIELADGQSFAIAGLLKEDIREIVSKYPVLGDIPILGALFRSSSFKKNETELIVIVTAHLVKPLDMTKQTLPSDPYIEPNDFEFYLLGNLEGKGKKAPPTRGGLEGDFGHILPR
ncbi:MAG: type II and III secretion system protein family protein [Deltaproteobacteria bacterium]